ncbi:putative ankyrin repeat and fibronectin type-III domain-containing protein [Plasmopara halstedii]
MVVKPILYIHLKIFVYSLVLFFKTVNAAFFVPGDVPGPPEKVFVYRASDTSMLVQFNPPLHVKPEGVNGAPVLGYKVDVARRVNEVQTFSVAADGLILSGSYKVTFKSSRSTETTSCIPWNASEVDFEMALEELLNVDSVIVSRSSFGAVKNGFVYTVTFDGAYLVSGRQEHILVGDTTGCQATQPPNRILSFAGAHVTTGVAGFFPEVWEIVSTESSGTKMLGGTFDVSIGFEGQWTDTIPVVTGTVMAGSRVVETSASMLGRVNRGDKVRIGQYIFTVHATAPFTDSELPLDSYHVDGAAGVTIEVFDTALGNVQVTETSNLIVTSSDFTGKIETGEQVRIGSRVFEVTNVATGTMTLSSAWMDDTTLHITAYARKKTTLSMDVEATEMKRALGRLPGIGSIDVSRVGPTRSNGYHWYVTFQSLYSVSLRVDKKKGATEFFDVHGVACATCSVTASVVKDETQTNTLASIMGEYDADAIVASQEASGLAYEVQTISTQASADDLNGYFVVSFQGAGDAVIYFDDTAADVRTKLQNLATIGQLSVTRADYPDYGATWYITFLSNLGDLPALVISDKSYLKGTEANVNVQELVKGVDVAEETIIKGLQPGQDYYVRAFARNENGYGGSTTALQQRGRGAQPLSTTIATAPDPPGISGIWRLSHSQMELRLATSVDHGDPVTKYYLEYAVGDTFGTAATKKIFIFNSLANDTVGTFRLQYGDDVTYMLPMHTSASSLQKALNHLPSVRPTSVVRALYVLTGTPSTIFVSANSRARIDIGGKRFTIRVRPTEGSSSIDVEPGHGILDFTATVALLKLDDSGSERGPYGYIWTISFDNDNGDVVHGKYPGLQLLSSLTSVDTNRALPASSYGIINGRNGISADHYGSFEIDTDQNVCDTYVVGVPSPVQVIQLFGLTTVTDGTFKLKLGGETTDCITIGKASTLSTLKSKLEALDLVSRVSVNEVRAFKVTTTMIVTDYDSTGEITVATPLTTAQVGILLQNTIIQVSRNSNDFSRHSCEFVVNTAPIAGVTKISVTLTGSCDYFTTELRSLKILDFHDYRVRFWGHYPTGEWPTLQFDSSAFGSGVCSAWAPSNLQVYGHIHSVKYEGRCFQGQAEVQTIIADASSTIGGTFTLSYMGKMTMPLSFKSTGAAEMRDAIDSITAPGSVNVSVSECGNHGKAWRVTFAAIRDEDQDAIIVQHSRLTGQSASISVYPTISVFTRAKRKDITGTFRISVSGETTEPIGFTATHMKVVQELQKLPVVNSVMVIGDKVSQDLGVYALELTADATGGSKVLTNIRLDGTPIDPTLFMAIGEILVIGTSPANSIRSMSPHDVTLAYPFPGASGLLNYKVSAGSITKQTTFLPGFVGISHLMQVIAVAKASNVFQLPVDHQFTVNSVFYIGDTKFTATAVSGAIVTTDISYTGESVAAASPKVYIFDNKIKTTEDLRNLVRPGDDLWLPSLSAKMNNFKVYEVNAKYLQVIGSFTESIARTRVYHVGNGLIWNLVFRSYDGNLETLDAIPESDWRGTDARIGTRGSKAAIPNVINIGNPASTQTIRLNVHDISIATTYTMSFAGETILDAGTLSARSIPWATSNDDMKQALESLDSVDGVSVMSVLHGGTVVHTVSFWGTYPMKKLPLLVITPASANLKAYVHCKSAVSVTKQDNLILECKQAYSFRVFALNSKGISDAMPALNVQTSTSTVVPSPPRGVALGEFHGSTWLSLNYLAPLIPGDAKVTMYRIEWDSKPEFDSSSPDYGVAIIQEKNEVQQVTSSYRSSVGIGGVFTLSLGGQRTSALPFDCSVEDMADALAGLTGTSNAASNLVEVTRVRAAWGFAWKITFLYNCGDLALLVADSAQLTGDFPQLRVTELVQGFKDLAIGDFTHEVQEVASEGVSPISGSFSLNFNGQMSASIDVGASALTMQAALQATSAMYSIKVTKTVRDAAVNTAVWSVTFAYLRGEKMIGAGNIFMMTVAESHLTGTGAFVYVANKVTGSDSFRFALTDLRPGVRYFAHVMAYNADGFGSATSPLATAITCSQPRPPLSVIASVLNESTLTVSWGANTAESTLCKVDRYKVDWYRAEGIQEQQMITTSAAKGLPEIQRLVSFVESRTIAGYFKLAFGGEVTQNIRWNADGNGFNSVKESLERLTTVGIVDVSRTESTRAVGGLLVTVTSTTVTVHATSRSTLFASKLAQGDAIWIAGNKRTITSAVGFADTTLVIDTALEVTVPVPVFESAHGFEWKITFLAGHIGPQELIQVFPSDNWTGNNPGIIVDSIQKGLQPISGTFKIAFTSGEESDSTPPLPHNISDIDLQTALENLVTIEAVNVTRFLNGNGYNWIVTFLSEVKNELSLLSVDGTALQGPGARVVSARILSGTQPRLYCEQDGIAGSAAEVRAPGLSYVIRRLQTGIKYAIRVRAHNCEGYGSAASIDSGFETPRSRPDAPQNTRLMILSSKYLKLQWKAPSSDGGVIVLGYRLQWDTASTFSNVYTPNYDYQTVVLVNSSDTGPFFFNIFTPVLATYYVRILAFNDQGDGPHAIFAPNNARPVDRNPGQPEDAKATVLSSYAILVEWNASSIDKYDYGGNGGLPITQYMIEWDLSSTFNSPAAFDLVDGAKRSFIIGGDDAITGVRSDLLVAGSNYSIRVTAFNAKGSSAPRLTLPPSVVVADQAPSAPQNLTLSVVSATAVRAAWTSPVFYGGSSPKSYELEWGEKANFAEGYTSSTTIPIVREMQTVLLQSQVVHEEQFIDATVEVVNEQQQVRSSFSGKDEIQLIKTTSDPVRDEVQKVVTSATDIDEIQELHVDDDDIDEIQAIRTSVAEASEVQEVKIGVERVNEVQRIQLFFTGGVGNVAAIGGSFYLKFDTTVCTYCDVTQRHRADTMDLIISSLQEVNDLTAATVVKTQLQALDNIDAVDVSRTSLYSGAGISGDDLTYIYLITFTGNMVGGNVPLIDFGGSLTYNGYAITPVFAEETKGNEPKYDLTANSVFSLTYTCESYSNPTAASTFSAECTPSVKLCDYCVTSFDGVKFTVSADVSGAITRGTKLMAGVCSFEVDAKVVTSGITTIDIAYDDPGALCTKFTGRSFALYKTPQIKVLRIPVKTSSTMAVGASEVQSALNVPGLLNAMTVGRNLLVTSTFVGAIYSVIFTTRTGKIPLLECDETEITPTQPNTAVECSVTRSSVGSMLSGTFKLGLISQADTDPADVNAPYSPTAFTSAIPWDATEIEMKSALEAVDTQIGKLLFGNVDVKRTLYHSTIAKWSGGFTWQITFTSRGWDIPTIVVDQSGLTTSRSNIPAAQIIVGDGTHSLSSPSVLCRDGNQVGGNLIFTFGSALAQTCTIGMDTSLNSLDTSVTDAKLQDFFRNSLNVPSVSITRSAASQARGFSWTITFIDDSTPGDLPVLEFTAALTSNTGSNNRRASIIEIRKGNELGGAFQLQFNGEVTGPIPAGADESAVQAQLNSLRTIKPSSVIVTRTLSSPQVKGYTWLITFHSSVWADPTMDHSAGIIGNWKGPATAWDDVWESGYSKAWGRHVGHTFLVTCDKSSLVTSTNDNSHACITDVVTVGIGPIGGTFAVTFDSSQSPHLAVRSVEISDPIAHNAFASKEESGNTGTSVEELLEKMANIGDVQVSRGVVDRSTGGYQWTVTFLRDTSDISHPCEELEILPDGSKKCNSPGNVPLMTTIDAHLKGSINTHATVMTIQDGAILRGDFTDLKVLGDAGVDERYTVSIGCTNSIASSLPCSVTSFAIVSGGSTLRASIEANDRFIVDGITSCIFTVVGVDSAVTPPTKIDVKPLDCAALNTDNTASPLGMSILIPWNGDSSLVKRVLEAASTIVGRKVSVSKTVLGKYGEMSWLVRFISNPSYTPLGAGNIPTISATFQAETTVSSSPISVIELMPGSNGLSGSFFLDFFSSLGRREVMFDEDAIRLERKINEMDTIGRVSVERFEYPSAATGCLDSQCSGGWEDQPVTNPGTRGGYRWRIRFLRVAGEYEGVAFPPGSGNLNEFSATFLASLHGNNCFVSVYTETAGSAPILGTFKLTTPQAQTPSLLYSSTAEAMKQGIEGMGLFGEVDVTYGYLSTQKIPGVTAQLARDSLTATISGMDDIRQIVAPTDIIRFGSTNDVLLGSNGDTPFASSRGTSLVTVNALSPVVVAVEVSSTQNLYPGMQLRIDGLSYIVQRSGHEIQAISVAIPKNANPNTKFYALKLSRAGVVYGPTVCFSLSASDADLQSSLLQLVREIDRHTPSSAIIVSRSTPVITATTTEYVYTVYFFGDAVAGNVATLQTTSGTCTGITGASASVSVITHGGNLPHQRLSLATNLGQVFDTSGYYTMSLDSAETECIRWGATERELKDALENTLNTGKVIVTRRGGGKSTTEIQRLRMTANLEVTESRGLFQLQLTLDGKTSSTDCIDYGISAMDLQIELNKLSNLNIIVDHINVTREGDGSSVWGYGFEYFIHFRGPKSGGYSPVIGDVPLLKIANVGQNMCSSIGAGVHPILTIETVREGTPAYTYDIYFLDYTKSASVPTIGLNHEGQGSACLTGWYHSGGSVRRASIISIERGGSSEVQVLIISSEIAASRFLLDFAGQTTTCFHFDASALEIENALNALTTVEAGGVSVSRDIDFSLVPKGYVYRITFVGDLVSGNAPLLIVKEATNACLNAQATTKAAIKLDTEGGQNSGAFALTTYYDGEAPQVPHVAYSISQQFSVLSEQFEVQQLVIFNAANDIGASATYKLTFREQTTTVIPWDASDIAVEIALTVAGVDRGDITVTRRPDSADGFVYTIYFSGLSVTGDLSALVPVSLNNFNTGQVLVSTIRDGRDTAATFTSDTIPLAQVNAPNLASRCLAGGMNLDVYKVNGFIWTIKFKSSLGNISKLGIQSSALSADMLTVTDDFVPGSASNSCIISNLLAGVNYFFHVAATTDIGTGPYSPTRSIAPSDAASAVQNIEAGYAMFEREVQEIRLAASHVSEVQEITSVAASIAEVQTLQTYVSPSLCPIGPCITGSFAFRIPTVQTVTIFAQGPITSGTFALFFVREVEDPLNLGSFKSVGAKTSAISWHADASTIENALITVTNGALTTNDIVVTRDGDASKAFNYGYSYQITFVGSNVAGETWQMECLDASFVTIGSVPFSCEVAMKHDIAMGTDTAVQQVIVKAKKTLVAGSYSLQFNHLGAIKTSSCIPFDASARTMDNILEAMSNIDHVYVTREMDSTIAPNGFVYKIFFHGNGVYGDVNQLTFFMCTNFQTEEMNALSTVGVDGQVAISMVDYGGFNALNTFVSAASATAAKLTTDLTQLPVFGNVSVSQSLVDKQGGYFWTVAFNDADGDLPQFICAVDTTFRTVPGAVCETDTLTDGNVISGSFSIEGIPPIPFDADAQVVQNALEAVAWIGTVQVRRSPASPQRGFTWTITFVDYRGDAPLLLVTNLLSGTSNHVMVREIIKGSTIGGTFSLSYQNKVTTAINCDALAMAAILPDGSSVQEKLQAIDGVGQVDVERSGPTSEGGYTWLVTFLDDVLNSGDLPLLQSNSSALTGENALVFTREVTKGSKALGNQLWLSFDPPLTDYGSAITKYQVRWDTSDQFLTDPTEIVILDPETIYRSQRITVSAPSFAWSNNRIQSTVHEVQKVTILSMGTFTLSFRGLTSDPLTTVAAGAGGATTVAIFKTTLEALDSIGTVVVSSVRSMLEVGAEVLITFTTQPGDLPLLKSTPPSVASVVETQTGITNFRKEVIIFSCTASVGTVRFSSNGKHADVGFNAALGDVETYLLSLFDVEAGNIRVSSVTQTVLCKSATPSDIKIVFDQVYTNAALTITRGIDNGADAVVVVNTDASINGIYNHDPTLSMSGTFQIGYQDSYTRPLNAVSSADQVRYALEVLGTINTVGVTRELSYQPLPGKVDVTHGEFYVTCSAGETCQFYSAAYGLPGYMIRIGGNWYTIQVDTSSPGLHKTRLYLGDAQGRTIGYLGSTDTAVTVYEWTKGYVWTVDMLSVVSPLDYMYAKVPKLHPSDASVQVTGKRCDKCYYLPTQTSKKLISGQPYYIEVYAYNSNGKGRAPASPTMATPNRVPDAPSNVDLVVTSGQQIEVFFSPPRLVSTSMSSKFNEDISSYIVQWDLDGTFKHGLPVCTGCAKALNGVLLTVTILLGNILDSSSKISILELGCVLEVANVMSSTVVQVIGGHRCENFHSRSYSLSHYQFPPAIVSGALIQTSPPYRYLISNLAIGVKYFVRVAAVNSVPIQKIALSGVPHNNRLWSLPLCVVTKDRAPDAPVSVVLYPFSGTILQLHIQPSQRDGKGSGGSAITSFWIDIDTVSTFDSAAKNDPIEILTTSGLIPELYVNGPRVYSLTDLTTGTRYFAQVKAKNSIGYSRATFAPVPVAPKRHPDAPVNTQVTTLITSSSLIDSATVIWHKPPLNGGLGLTNYKIEWWRALARPEVQVVELTWVMRPTAASFALSFRGGKSEFLDSDVTAENFRSALMNLASGALLPISYVDVSRNTINNNLGYHWIVTFANTDVNGGDQPMLQLEIGNVVGGAGVTGRVFELTSGITVPSVTTFPGKAEVQVLVTYHPTATVEGYFRLGYKGSAWTAFLPARSSAMNVKIALEGLSTVGVVSVRLESMEAAGQAFTLGQVWTITYLSIVGNLPPLVVESSKVTPADAFIGVKDGDNAVDSSGMLCLPGSNIVSCPGSWPPALGALKQQVSPFRSIVELASSGEIAVDYAFYETSSAATLTYTIPNLIPGQAYHIAVTAKNALGLGMRSQVSFSPVTPPLQLPGPPTNISVEVNPGVATQLLVTWAPPISDGGNAVRMYRIEYDPSPMFINRGQQDVWCPNAPTHAVWRVQTVRTSPAASTSTIASGYFHLELTHLNTISISEPIPWNAAATARDEVGSSIVANSRVFCTVKSPTCPSMTTFPFGRRQLSGSMQSKLHYFNSITNGVDVQRTTQSVDGGYTWSITFLDPGDSFALAATNVKLTCADPTLCLTATYDVVVTKVRAGVMPLDCVGSHNVPSIGALNKGQLYYVRISAYNEVGFGKPGFASNPQKPMVVPGPPTTVILAVYSLSQLVLLFSPPDDNGGDAIAAYEIQWAVDSAFTIKNTLVVTIVKGMSAPYRRVVSSLVKGTPYFFRIRARNSLGYGPFQQSSPTKLQPYETPSAPTQVALGVTSATMLTVSWAPPSDDGGDTISAYTVQWDITAGFDSLSLTIDTTVTINDPTQRSYTLTGLRPQMLYYVRVFAKNRGGQGTPQTSTPSSLVPAVTYPGKPNTLTVAPTSVPGELRVKWLAPVIPYHGYPCAGTLQTPASCPVIGAINMAYGGVDLEQYLIQYSEMTDFSTPIETTTSSSVREVLLSGLVSGKIYYVQVLAQNFLGRGYFCKRTNTQSLLCPDHQVLQDGTVVTGSYVYAAPL